MLTWKRPGEKYTKQNKNTNYSYMKYKKNRQELPQTKLSWIWFGYIIKSETYFQEVLPDHSWKNDRATKKELCQLW